MKPEDIVELYRALDQAGVAIWIDGGWAVDAVVGRQTRSHNDLDIAVEARALARLQQFNGALLSMMGAGARLMFTSSFLMNTAAFGLIRLMGLPIQLAP
jgi:hypothetical protein